MKRLQGGKVVDYDPFTLGIKDTPPILEMLVPDGSISDVLKWVGDDPYRADAALKAELSKEAPRSTLVDKLS